MPRPSAILPASGLATRMRGLPKFLLPCDDQYLSLLERHIDELSKICETIWIPVRPDLVPVVESLSISSENVIVVAMATSSMTETVRRVVEIGSSERFVMVMPDTFFFGEAPYKLLAEAQADLFLACWMIRKEQAGRLGQVDLVRTQANTRDWIVKESRDKDPNCHFPFSWGAMSFNRGLIDLTEDSMPHLGHVIEPAIRSGNSVRAAVMDGQYFDCGTPAEYLSMLQTRGM